MTERVLTPLDCLTAPLSSIGAKAARLARLAEEGIPVPSFFVVSAHALELHLGQNGIPWPAGAGNPLWSTWRSKVNTMPIDTALSREILVACDRLSEAGGPRRVAVRSSGGEEDSPTASFAGQFTSVLNLEGHAVLGAVQKCWASYVSDRSIQYRAAKGIALPGSPSFGVIVQTQVFSREAGIMFTVHPLDPGGDVGYVEANFGTGESVVGGLATPDAAVFSRSSGDIVATVTATKRRMTTASPAAMGTQVSDVGESQRRAPVLTEGQVREIAAMGMRIEELMDEPQDIEWAFDSQQLWILQTRPITALAPRTR